MSNFRDETGSMSVLAIAAMATMTFAFLVIGYGFSIAHEYRITQQGADLSALAGASVVQSNPGNVCGNAELVAQENRVQLESCVVAFGVVEIKVRSTRVGLVKASSRAGIF